LFHAEADGVDGVGLVDGERFVFVDFDEGGEQLEFIGLGRARAGVHKLIDAGERGFVFPLVLNDFRFHRTASASVRS
jgi:hypothetical protein